AIAKLGPQIEGGVSGLGPHSIIAFGGKQIGDSIDALTQVFRDVTTGLNMGSGIASTLGSYSRREEDWKFQLDIADKELKQMDKAILASEIRVAIAGRELDIHEKQMEQVDEVFDFYRNQFANLGLYTWLAKEVKGLYRQAYRMAL